MATVIRKTDPAMVEFATALNDLKSFAMAQLRLAQADVATIAADVDVGVTPTFVSLGAHNDKSESTITSADASTLGTSLTLVNEVVAVYRFHMADTLAHKTTGVALTSYATATTLAEAIVLANDVKSKYNTHRASTTYHYVADSTNVIAAANASDQGTLNTLLNELKADINLHMASGPAGSSIRLVDA